MINIVNNIILFLFGLSLICILWCRKYNNNNVPDVILYGSVLLLAILVFNEIVMHCSDNIIPKDDYYPYDIYYKMVSRNKIRKIWRSFYSCLYILFSINLNSIIFFIIKFVIWCCLIILCSCFIIYFTRLLISIIVEIIFIIIDITYEILHNLFNRNSKSKVTLPKTHEKNINFHDLHIKFQKEQLKQQETTNNRLCILFCLIISIIYYIYTIL